MGGSPSGRGRPVRVLLAAGLLFAGIFLARLLADSPTSGLTILYVLPVVLVGVELGRRAGALAGVVAFFLFTAWSPFAPIAIDPSAYVTRLLVLVVVGAVAGHLAERMRAAAAEAQASARHFDLAGDLLCTANLGGYLIHLNGAWEQTLGWTREELTARPFLDFVHPDDRARTEAEAARAADDDFTARFSNRYRTKDGAWRWIEWCSRLDRERGLIHAAARDVTEQRAAEEQLRYLADHDPLSGVFNRRRFEQELQRELGYAARDGASTSALLLLDVDRFKAINDGFGHATGDAVIARLGDTLCARLRSADVVARLGGDEFAAILRRTDKAAARDLVDELRAAVAERLAELVGDDHGAVTLSAGLVAIDGDAVSADQLLLRADRALYTAKAAGRDRVVVDDGPAVTPRPA